MNLKYRAEDTEKNDHDQKTADRTEKKEKRKYEYLGCDPRCRAAPGPAGSSQDDDQKKKEREQLQLRLFFLQRLLFFKKLRKGLTLQFTA